MAYRSTNDSKNPIIISIGHRVSSETAVKVVKACIKKFRIPEPVSINIIEITFLDPSSRLKIKRISKEILRPALISIFP